MLTRLCVCVFTCSNEAAAVNRRTGKTASQPDSFAGGQPLLATGGREQGQPASGWPASHGDSWGCCDLGDAYDASGGMTDPGAETEGGGEELKPVLETF